MAVVCLPDFTLASIALARVVSFGFRVCHLHAEVPHPSLCNRYPTLSLLSHMSHFSTQICFMLTLCLRARCLLCVFQNSGCFNPVLWEHRLMSEDVGSEEEHCPVPALKDGCQFLLRACAQMLTLSCFRSLFTLQKEDPHPLMCLFWGWNTDLLERSRLARARVLVGPSHWARFPHMYSRSWQGLDSLMDGCSSQG